jgi:hypothetical protein
MKVSEDWSMFLERPLGEFAASDGSVMKQL